MIRENDIPRSAPTLLEVQERDPSLTQNEYASFLENASLKINLAKSDAAAFERTIKSLREGYEKWRRYGENSLGLSQNDEIDKTDPVFEELLQSLAERIREFQVHLVNITNHGDLLPAERVPGHPNLFVFEAQLDALRVHAQRIRARIVHMILHDAKQAPKTMHSSNYGGRPPAHYVYKDLADASYARFDNNAFELSKRFTRAVLMDFPDETVGASLLFNSGTAAFRDALIHAVSATKPERILRFGKQYWENGKVFDKFINPMLQPNCEIFLGDSTQEIIEAIRSERPPVIILETIANQIDMTVLDIPSILTALGKTSHPKPTYVIIDYTVTGPITDFKHIISSLPDDVVLLATTSLQKMFQHGEDVASSGLLTVICKNSFDTEFVTFAKIGELRGLGGAITTQNTAVLEQYGQESTKAYALCIAKNTKDLADHFAELRAREGGVLKSFSVHYPFNESQGDSAPFFFLKFDHEHDAERFINACPGKTRLHDADIAFGASWGFSTTRIFKKGGFVRVSPGIENVLQMKRLKRALGAALAR